MIRTGERPVAYKSEDVDWLVAEVNKLRSSGLKATRAIAQLCGEFKTRTFRETNPRNLAQLYYSALRRSEARREGWLILAVHHNGEKTTVFASIEEVQSKLGHLAKDYDLYKARKLEVKVVTRLVVS